VLDNRSLCGQSIENHPGLVNNNMRAALARGLLFPSLYHKAGTVRQMPKLEFADHPAIRNGIDSAPAGKADRPDFLVGPTAKFSGWARVLTLIKRRLNLKCLR
jgi:hypothetical protein